MRIGFLLTHRWNSGGVGNAEIGGVRTKPVQSSCLLVNAQADAQSGLIKCAKLLLSLINLSLVKPEISTGHQQPRRMEI